MAGSPERLGIGLSASRSLLMGVLSGRQPGEARRPNGGRDLGDGRWLLLETSGRIGQVGVARGAELLAARRLDAARRHARDLVPAVGELFRGQGWRARGLTGVIVGRGPGSYTGLRVGLSAAKALAYATGCALVAVDTFAVIARQADVAADRLEAVA